MIGVNLGGWLVLEKWMTPRLFADVSAQDEYGYSLVAMHDATVSARLTKHRDTFVTESDFAWLAEHGVQAVRLPVGYWMFGDESPYQGTAVYVDKAFEWAERYNLRILIDLHGAPGSQNGWDHSGRVGRVGWHMNAANTDRTLAVIERLAIRYGRRPALLGFELMNEPKWTLPKRTLREYYVRAYDIVRRHSAAETWVVFHDNFRPRRWRRELGRPKFANVYIDTHWYQCFSWWDKLHGVMWHLRKAEHMAERRLGHMRRRHPVVVGEWSLALDRRSSARRPAELSMDDVYSAYAAAQQRGFRRAAAWFFWSYKTERSDAWSFKMCIEKGWLKLNS